MGILGILNGFGFGLGLWCQSTLITGVQFLSLFIWPVSRRLYYKFQAHIMRQWANNLFLMMRLFAPGDLIVTLDESCTREGSGLDEEDEDEEERLERLLTRNKQGEVIGISFPEKLIMMANHQILVDWIYIWFLAYLSKAHGSLKIMLKHSLSLIPIYGTKLESDKDTVINNLERARKRNMPMWLMLFPEGTVISDDTRARSKAYAQKFNMEDYKFTLLPRTTGLLLCKDTLGDSVEWLYDLTIGYPGIPVGENPEDALTMKYIFCDRKGPHKIHIHIRRYRIDSLPSDPERFTPWLFERWAEKDKRLVYYNETGKFPEEPVIEDEDELLYRRDRTVKVPLKLRHTIRECFGYWLYFIFYLPLVLVLVILIKTAYEYAYQLFV
ncbi:hypothetical protein RMCBS344292_03982 [Rhizopus microsporus]|nr:hypothetical protein RMCBS344292_03982 [Rhizopus microsporus]